MRSKEVMENISLSLPSGSRSAKKQWERCFGLSMIDINYTTNIVPISSIAEAISMGRKM
jgi:hypothetical protein